MLKLTVGVALVALVACLQCPADEVCEAGQTCCQTPTGETTCCPFHHGECCEDHLHCCPEGMLCKVMESICWNETDIQPWVERTHFEKTSLPKSFRMIPSLPASENEITCPDGSYCPAEFSCLLMSTSYGCCPVAQGIVCSDGKHCCPKGNECSADSSSCLKPKAVETVFCGDEKSECPVDSTCCETEVDGQWGCCPMPKAVCCDDKVHCCPEDSVCDVKSSRCVSSTNQELPMWTKFSARLRAEWEDHKPAVVTPEMSTKPGLTTNGQTTTALNKIAFLEISSSSDVPCDDTVACPDDSTCCKTKEGGWACCPLPKAVCCDDFIHCCPTGKKCNVAAETCEDPSGSVPWFKKVPGQPISSWKSADTQVTSLSSSSDVPCDDTVACPDDSTCCKTKEGGWACCPLPKAVCCDDFIHCCPTGKKCNVAAETCDDPSGSVPWLEKVSARPRAGHRAHVNVSCDSNHICPESNTCCKNIDGDWNCCPMPEAVCCKDGEHCCPAHYECDVGKVSCIKKDVVIPWYNKIPAQSTPSPSSDRSTVACDEQFSCAAETTCCRLSTGKWGCCPLPEAVCCPDHEHCCPKDYTCDMGGLSCVKHLWLELDRVPLTQIVAKKTEPISSVKDIQCGGGFSCPDGETCCPTSKTTWACCPSPKAMCCDDMKHCCPNGYTCGEGGTCTKPASLKWKSWRNWNVFFSQKK